jgi:predicted MFS family arabinose efflux permease
MSADPSLKAAGAPTQPALTARLVFLLACACGLLVGSLYYIQPLVGPVAASIGLAGSAAGLLVTAPLAGYGLGLFALVPLADLHENRRLVIGMLAVHALCLALLSVVHAAWLFLAVAFVLGMAASCAQILIPLSTFLARSHEQGKVVGRLVSGVMAGIMLARPLASGIADAWMLRGAFAIGAPVSVLLAVLLARNLPARVPVSPPRYGALLVSMGHIIVEFPVLRRRGFYHGCMFGAFATFWTGAPLWLSGPTWGLTQRGIALVGLVGAAGAIAPWLAGPLADRGHGRTGTLGAMLIGAVAMYATLLCQSGSALALAGILAAAVALDLAVAANLVFSQRAIYALDPSRRGRINSIFMTSFFIGGALASSASAWQYAHTGWVGVAALAGTLPLIALVRAFTARGD